MIPSVDAWSAVSHSRCCPLRLWNWTNYSRAQIQKRSRNSCSACLSSQQFSDYANRQNHLSGSVQTIQHTEGSVTAPFWLPSRIDRLRLQKHLIDLGFICQPIQIAFNSSAPQLTCMLASRWGACPSQSTQEERERRQHLRWPTRYKWWKESLKDRAHVSEWARSEMWRVSQPEMRKLSVKF